MKAEQIFKDAEINEHGQAVLSADEYADVCREIGELKAERDGLRESLKRTAGSLKTAMTGYRKEANTIPNYDIGESVLFDAFNETLAEADKLLEEE